MTDKKYVVKIKGTDVYWGNYENAFVNLSKSTKYSDKGEADNVIVYYKERRNNLNKDEYEVVEFVQPSLLDTLKQLEWDAIDDDCSDTMYKTHISGDVVLEKYEEKYDVPGYQNVTMKYRNGVIDVLSKEDMIELYDHIKKEHEDSFMNAIDCHWK